MSEQTSGHADPDDFKDQGENTEDSGSSARADTDDAGSTDVGADPSEGLDPAVRI